MTARGAAIVELFRSMLVALAALDADEREVVIAAIATDLVARMPISAPPAPSDESTS